MKLDYFALSLADWLSDCPEVLEDEEFIEGRAASAAAEFAARSRDGYNVTECMEAAIAELHRGLDDGGEGY